MDNEAVDFKNEREVLKIALENEIKGRDLYVQFAKKLKNELARKVFVHLANQELKHIEDIKKFMGSFSEGIDIDVDSMIEKGSLEKTKHFFGQLVDEIKEQVHPSDDDNKARQLAMDIEKAAYHYYKLGAATTKDERLKKLFEWLLEQEQYHFMLIRNAFDYANNPESWYAGEEHWVLEG